MPLNLNGVTTPQYFRDECDKGFIKSVMTTNCPFLMSHRTSSTLGIKEGCGLLYWPTSAKDVSSLLPPLGFLTRKEVLRYVTLFWKRWSKVN